MQKEGIPFSVNVSIDYKSAAIFACALFIGMAAALIIFKKV